MFDDMLREPKVIATGFIWIAAIVISLGLMFSPFIDEEWLLSIPVTAAFLSTLAVWLSGKSSGEAIARLTQSAAEKSKRGAPQPADADSKMRLLLELMDDDERQAFKDALKRQMLGSAGANDGELDHDTLESLLDDAPKRRRGG